MTYKFFGANTTQSDYNYMIIDNKMLIESAIFYYSSTGYYIARIRKKYGLQ